MASLLRSRAGRLPSCALRQMASVREPRSNVVLGVRTFFTFGKSSAAQQQSAAELFARVKSLHESVLKPINTRVSGPLGRDTDELIPLPMVLVLGNHSSGKSTFINYILGRQVQNTGVAPTDDSFTVIAPGQSDADQDGPSLVGDPTWGFGGLRQFGTVLINHLQLKIRGGTGVREVLLVDSPGMIDAPNAPGSSNSSSSGLGGYGYGGSAVGKDRSRDRGYDFSGTMKWFAERADLILLFQDPAKPGTTGETLDVMTSALAGQDFKTLIVLNKADVFSNVHDFARSYGTLTWNLSKVIPRKDLPPIYTMCVPIAARSGEGGAGSIGASSAPSSGGLKEALADLAATRDEIVGEVLRAPLRRVDNMITRLYDSARLLRMHAAVATAVKKEYAGEVAKHAGALGVGAVGLAGLAGSLLYGGNLEFGAPLAAVTLLGTAGGGWWVNRALAAKREHYLDGPGLDEAFRRVHFLQLAERDEFCAQLWERVRPQLASTLRTLGFAAVPMARRSDLQALDEVIEREVPALRQAASKAGALVMSIPTAGGGTVGGPAPVDKAAEAAVGPGKQDSGASSAGSGASGA